LIVFPRFFWAADPFTPPENIQLFYQAIYPDPSEPPIDYKMYMQTGDKVIGLLNGQFVSEGDTFGDMKVISVNSNRVILSSSTGEKRVIVIDAMQSKLQKLREMMSEGNP
jgi:hypothetical protein